LNQVFYKKQISIFHDLARFTFVLGSDDGHALFGEQPA